MNIPMWIMTEFEISFGWFFFLKCRSISSIQKELVVLMLENMNDGGLLSSRRGRTKDLQSFVVHLFSARASRRWPSWTGEYQSLEFVNLAGISAKQLRQIIMQHYRHIEHELAPFLIFRLISLLFFGTFVFVQEFPTQ